ncbi:hypothetical protein [Raoultella ornithinolytica]|uniref:hypothetical protein n=1 Tax=Raoultella ornithinolytica TaxID=54291 RepID=UPI002857F047|nr:hypothetical protein [Raoultella ornithinolytica]
MHYTRHVPANIAGYCDISHMMEAASQTLTMVKERIGGNRRGIIEKGDKLNFFHFIFFLLKTIVLQKTVSAISK